MSDLRQYSWSEAHSPDSTFAPVRVYVWELPVRVSHWFIFLPVVVLSVTGYYMHNPFIVGKSSTTFLMATMRFTHLVAAFVFIAAFLLRVYWFFVGNNWSNWRAFVPLHRRQWRGMGGMVAYYSFLRRDLLHHVGHNALAAVTYLVMFLLMFIEILTGLALYSQVRGSSVLNALIGWLPRLIDIQNLRLMHFCIMFSFFIFVIHHVYSAVLVSWEERNGLIESIFTGYKFVPTDELEEDATSRSPR
ncbi:MAG: Ni/Fe-hydrogenase, b-type cytochrome subunit [Acidobacteriia bacterium]|nr:Ni/Fe-hydrogenase, b-type cytochrome subunit [Terriglobia bacterium]